MVNDDHSLPATSTQPFQAMRTTAKAIGTLILGILGLVLLVADKSTAGAALLCSAFILLLPLGRLAQPRGLTVLSRIVVLAILCTIAIRSVANTDIVPGQSSTGFKFADQVLAIFDRFQQRILGSEIEEEIRPGPAIQRSHPG